LIFNINVQNLVDDPNTQMAIRACSQAESVSEKTSSAKQDTIISPESNCGAKVKKFALKAQASSNHSSSANLSSAFVNEAVGQLAAYLRHAPACGTTVLFAKSGDVAVGLYSGAEIEHRSATDFVETFQRRASQGDQMLQVCEANATASQSLGLFASTLDKLLEVQQAIRTWANSKCIESASSVFQHVDVEVGRLVSTVESNSTTPASRHDRREFCRDIQVAPGDSCASLASRCGISGNDFTKYNPQPNLCAKLMPKQFVCCTKGDLPDRMCMLKTSVPPSIPLVNVCRSQILTIQRPCRHTTTRS